MICPDHTQVTLFVQGELPVEDVSRFEAHIDGCERCLALIARASEAMSIRHGADRAAQSDAVFIQLIAALARRSDRLSTSDPPVPPERFGPYRVLGILGRGGMGIVYRAVHDGSGRSVAIKTVAAARPKLLAGMREEIGFLQHLEHPGIVRIFENGVVDGDPWYAMELLEGSTLENFSRSLWRGASVQAAGRSWLHSGEVGSTRATPAAAGGRLGDVLALFVRVCAPLGFLHRAGFVHCDLKPANIFIRAGGQPVLMDFGLLSRAGGAIGRESLEIGGQLRGTLPYLSPELIRGQIPDARADLYGLGCILYESVTGRPPFVAHTAKGFLEAHLRSEPMPASQLVSGIPKLVDELLASLLAKRPDQRIGDANVVAEVLMQAIRTPESVLSSPRPATPYLFRPRMVGRGDVVERILALRANAERGHGHFLLISGESGIGKTFLASEIAQSAARAGFEVVTGECVPVPPAERADREIIGVAFAPFRKLLQNAADRCRKGAPDVATRLFGSEQTIRLLARYEPALGHLLGPAAVEDLARLPPSGERERVLRALADLLDRLAEEGPLLLIIDDLQWSDELSLAFLSSLSANAFADRRLLLLALYRSDEVSKPILDLERKEHVQSLRLEPLDLSALTSMVGDLLSDEPSAEFVQTLAAHSEGNPFFVAEYLRAAATEGILERTAEGWRLAFEASRIGYGALELPRSLQALLERRLALLTHMTQRVTEAAAVLGREFHVPLLTAVAGGPAEDISRALSEMLERQVVQRLSEDRLRFLHDKTREAAYARLDSERRRELHRAAANVIEAAYATSPELAEHYAELAYHFRRGEESARAVDYFEKGAELALRNSANADVVRFLREAREISAAASIPISVNRRASWERKMGEALQSLGDLEGSKTHLLRAVSLLGWPMPETPARIVLGIVPKLARQLLHRGLSRRWIEADRERSEVLLEAARAYDRLQQVYYYRGEYLPLFSANLATLNLTERALPSPSLVTAYTNAAAVAGIVPLRHLAAEYFQLAEATLERAYDPEVESYFRMLQAVYLTGLGEWDAAADASTRALDLAVKLRFPRRWEETAGVRAIWAWHRDLEGRLHWARRLLESALRRDDPQMTSWGLLGKAEVLADRGDFDRAAVDLARAEDIVQQLGAPEQICALGTRCFLLFAAGAVDDATTIADRATALVAQTKPIHLLGITAYARIAEVQLATWAAAFSDRRRRAHARTACKLLASASRIFPIVFPNYCLHEGTRQWMCGHSTRALSIWKRGVQAACRLDLPYAEARLLLSLGQFLPPASEASKNATARGRHLAARLGVRSEVLLPVAIAPRSR
jgi:serine/threonine protein kinase/tetratricopeptide (TPR) repeat protein